LARHSDRFSVITQKGRPLFRRLRIPVCLPHPAQQGSLRDVEAEHPQLAVDTRRTQVLFSATMRKMSSRTSLLTRPLPAQMRCREIPFQYPLNPARCQRTTVAGRTITRASFEPDHNRLKTTQKSRSGNASLGYGCFVSKIARCCRRARISSSRDRGEWKISGIRPKKRLSVRSMNLF